MERKPVNDHAESYDASAGFIHTQQIVDAITPIHRVETVFTKDFSELTGAKAVIIAA